MGGKEQTTTPAPAEQSSVPAIAVQELVETRLAEFRDELPGLIADAVSNAMRHTPAGSVIDADQARLERQRRGKAVVIEFTSGAVIRNRGIGIPNVPFFAAKRFVLESTDIGAEDLLAEGLSRETFNVYSPEQWAAETAKRAALRPKAGG